MIRLGAGGCWITASQSVHLGHLRRLFGSSCLVCSRSNSRNDDEKAAYGISDEFINRNPRNLEMMDIAYKRRGWAFQAPRKDFYHKLHLEKGKNTSAKVVHCSGKVVVTASTSESAIAQHLSSTSNVNAARNIGRVIAHRCLQAGIERLLFDPELEGEQVNSFKNAVTEMGVDITEPEESPYGSQHVGTDYSRRNQS